MSKPETVTTHEAPDPWAVLDRFPAVSYETAGALLGVGARRLRQLVADGTLERVGRGHSMKITSASIRRYGGFERIPAKSGNERQKAAESGNAVSSQFRVSALH